MSRLGGTTLGLSILLSLGPAPRIDLQARPDDAGKQRNAAPKAPAEATTAEQLLRALRWSRPAQDVIPPQGDSTAALNAPDASLLPEGTTIVERTGRLGREGSWWTFVDESVDGAPPMKLLPNAALEVMVRTSDGLPSSVRFSVSGETTVFRGENFLLARLVRRRNEPPDSRTAAQENAPQADHRSANATVDPNRSSGPDTPASPEDVISLLQRQAPRLAVPPAPVTISPPAPRHSVGEPTGLRPEGTPLVRRPGRVEREGDWWVFILESDRPGFAEPKMRLLPGQGLETILSLLERNPTGLVLKISGEITRFENENHLLPRSVFPRIDADNLSK